MRNRQTCRHAALLVCAAVILGACGKPVGTPCTITGSGFHARQDCATKCLARWNVACPDGTRVLPNVCAGRETCQPDSCPKGQFCYHFDDPFDERSYCIPDDVCGAPPSAELRLRWETDSLERAAATRSHMRAKHGARTGTTSLPAEL